MARGGDGKQVNPDRQPRSGLGGASEDKKLHDKPCRNDIPSGNHSEWGFPHMLVGYMRVSTDGDRQVLDLQRDALLAAGVDDRHLFEDHASGSRGDRIGLAKGFCGRATAWWCGSWIAWAGRCGTWSTAGWKWLGCR